MYLLIKLLFLYSSDYIYSLLFTYQPDKNSNMSVCIYVFYHTDRSLFEGKCCIEIHGTHDYIMTWIKFAFEILVFIHVAHNTCVTANTRRRVQQAMCFLLLSLSIHLCIHRVTYSIYMLSVYIAKFHYNCNMLLGNIRFFVFLFDINVQWIQRQKRYPWCF